MTELLENSDNTNESAVVSESPANEATISLAVAQSLADALQKIESYTPTVWVDNESPDIDAAHLNKAEQAITRVTTAMNSAVDVIKDLQSQVNTTNNNLSQNLYKAVYTDDIFITSDRPVFVYWNGSTKNTPFKAGLTDCQEGFAFRYGAWADYMTVVCFVKNDSRMWVWSKSRNEWVEYASKSDLLNLSRTFVSGDSFSDAKDLSIPPGIYGVNPGLKNIPENTYGLLEVTADTVNNWRFLKFTPTNIKSHYLMFYNGYDKTWSEWVHFASTT